jgi:catalase
LQSLAASPSKKGEPSAADEFFGSHPAALAFGQAPKPTPASFAKEAYYGVNAFKLVNAEGKGTYFRYRITLEGVGASSDPLLEMRATVYLISGRERRAT